MRLSVQLALLVSALVLVLFAGTFAINLDNARSYLAAQLASHAEDAATSLGLSISRHLAEGDGAMVRSMADALFDHGAYLEVTVRQADDGLWVQRSAERVAPDVPGWFTRLVRLDTPLGASAVMDGWRQVGRVEVRSHPGFAYEQLWASTLETLAWYLAGALAAVVIGLVALRLLLKPLARVREQAEAICDREFPVVEHRPFTLDFRRLVEAMNRMSAKVKQMLDGAEQLAERLREQAYRDPVTGLANRRELNELLAHALTDPEGMSGGLVLVQLRDFRQYNLQHGYPAGDRLLQACAALLRDNGLDGLKATAAHLSGADFAVLLEGVDPDRFALQAERYADALAALTHQGELPGSDIGHVGAVYYRGHSPQELLSEADAALRRAQLEGANHCVVVLDDATAGRSLPATGWHDVLVEAVENRRLRLARQPVFDTGGRIIHEEVLLRLDDPDSPGDVLPANRFLPQAEALGLAGLLDRQVLERVLPDLDETGQTIAVNLSRRSLEDTALLTWVEEQLRRHRVGAGRLLLEVAEYAAGAHVEALRRWVDRLSPFGVEFCLDHYGRGFSSFRYLHGLKAHWLKVDGSFVRELDREPDNQFYLQALCEIAHGLDMRVIAESVETEAVWRLLPGLGVDGGQGYWLGRPE